MNHRLPVSARPACRATRWRSTGASAADPAPALFDELARAGEISEHTDAARATNRNEVGTLPLARAAPARTSATLASSIVARRQQRIARRRNVVNGWRRTVDPAAGCPAPAGLSPSAVRISDDVEAGGARGRRRHARVIRLNGAGRDDDIRAAAGAHRRSGIRACELCCRRARDR